MIDNGKKSTLEQLDEYVTAVFDKNGDGRVDLKELMASIPNMTVLLVGLFVELAVLIAEYRVADVGYAITGSYFKAAGFVLVSALPFYLGQVMWLYPRASVWQKAIGILFVLSGLGASAFFGYADLIVGISVEALKSYAPVMFKVMIILTPSYIALGLLYMLIDPVIRASRIKVETKAKAVSEKEMLNITKEILNELKDVIALKKVIAGELGGDEELGGSLIDGQMNMLRGTKPKKQQPPQNVPARAFNSDTELLQLREELARLKAEKENPQTGGK